MSHGITKQFILFHAAHTITHISVISTLANENSVPSPQEAVYLTSCLATLGSSRVFLSILVKMHFYERSTQLDGIPKII
jgi:hypothetical protein